MLGLMRRKGESILIYPEDIPEGILPAFEEIQNEELNKRLFSKESEVQSMGKRTLAMSEKQLTDKIALAKEVYLEAFDEGEKEKLLNAQEMLNEAQSDEISSSILLDIL